MSKNEPLKIALIGNPNTGKTSLFNQLTGLNQQVGNYPGITVQRKVGYFELANQTPVELIDLPGTYSLNTHAKDEHVVLELLMNKSDKNHPDVVIVVCDVENLKRNLFLFTQIKDLGLPTLLVFNMADRLKQKGISIDLVGLEKALKTKIILTSTRKGEGISNLKTVLQDISTLDSAPIFDLKSIDQPFFEKLQALSPSSPLYALWLSQTQGLYFEEVEKTNAPDFLDHAGDALKKHLHKETIKRYQLINTWIKQFYQVDDKLAEDFTTRIDRILTHKVFGFLIFIAILLLIFQAIFDWSGAPMDFIDESFGALSNWLSEKLPAGMTTSLLTEGLIPGISGVLIFIPQIAILFFFISLLEESGYMSRVVFMMDKIMRKFGLSGKSVVPLISGTACAIPAIMATRNIENWKERLVTILITPFTTCSARLPVYAIIIAIIIPPTKVFGLFGSQALMLLGLYLLGFLMAFIGAIILNKVIKTNTKSYFVVEMPNYKMPFYKNVGINVFEKTKAFVTGAGTIIISLSIVLWFLGAHGPSHEFEFAEKIVSAANPKLADDELADQLAAYKLEHSYMGIMGKAIEPAVEPLGYDWKIGIGVIASFAAREVFVGTMATIYNVGQAADDEETIKERMINEKHYVTKKPVYNFATGISLLLFYAFAMQCISTLAIVKKETNSWKWPMIQLIFMSGFAYLVAFLAYQGLK
jgi:ferrous iron transport protein B